MRQRLLDSLDAAEPPAGLSPPLQALWWLRKGGLRPGAEWERAHAICQRAGSRRTGADPAAEWDRMVAELGR